MRMVHTIRVRYVPYAYGIKYAYDTEHQYGVSNSIVRKFLFLRCLILYKVRIINPNKKSDFIVRQLHRRYSKFTSVTAIRVSLIKQFDEQVPDSVKFNVGYIDGRHQISLFSNEDLNLMYSKYKFGGEIILWCDSRCREENRGSRKRDIDTSLLKCQEREDQIDEIFKDLKSRHNDKYSVPQL